MIRSFWRIINSPIIVTLIFGLYFYFFFYYPFHSNWHTTTTRAGGTHYENYSTYYSYWNGKKYTSVVATSALQKTPELSPDLSGIPLTQGRAVVLAKGTLSKLTSDSIAFKVESVALDAQDRNHHYAYVVRFVPTEPASTSMFSIVVLLNGTVIEPKISGGGD